MKASALKYAVLTTAASLIMLILLLMPFHAFLTVWLSSLFGHYTAFRLWKEALLIVCGLATLFLILVDAKIRTMTLSRRLVQLILIYSAIVIVWGAVAYKTHAVSAKALGYGWIVDMRFLIFFLVVWAVALRTSRLHAYWRKLLLWPAVVVVVFGLLQVFVLPRNFLSHFGYGPQTIPAYETINHNIHYLRIASTLRGANPLGAYLLIPISALGVLIMRGKRNWRTISLLVASLFVLYFSFSRSAWIGAVLSLSLIVFVTMHSQRQRLILLSSAAGLVVIAGLILALTGTTRFDNIVFHTQPHSAAPKSSDQGHASALKSGLSDLLHDPLGRGPGSAGPASVYNNHPARLAENFYVQIGQELGWLGLLIFLLINVGIGYLLWLGRRSSLALSLLASFVGISFVNLLSHAWADDTLAYVWWGLAGIAIANLPYKAETDEAS